MFAKHILLGLGCLVSTAPLSAEILSAPKSLDALVVKMKGLRFCKSGGCLYRNIKVTLSSKQKDSYQALIKADIERPSRTIDTASYRLRHTSKTGWQLLGGNEATDVNETNYQGERYQSRSIYGNGDRSGLVRDLPTPTGYKTIYFDLLHQGQERK